MNLSDFGKKITGKSGIGELMDDLTNAISSGKEYLMLGGGTPARIPEIEAILRDQMIDLLSDGNRFENTISLYSAPEGDRLFREALAEQLNKQFGWDLDRDNIALTNGSQSAFFTLFNIFAGDYTGCCNKKIMFPLAPEYVGYSDVGLLKSEDIFTAQKPIIERLDEFIFKYRVDFKNLSIGDEVGALCVSRPTNPTGNVLTDYEVSRLACMAQDKKIPFIIDNAYGSPFPNVIFSNTKPIWNENIILCMSLSKFGLPGMRTGIVVANKKIITMMGKAGAILNLSPGSMGPAIAYDLVKSGKIMKLSNEIVKPYYKEKADRTLEYMREQFKGQSVYVHKPEGAFFLWTWFKDLPITAQELYEILKEKGVLIIPGQNFFPGINKKWTHTNECIRLNYGQDEQTVFKGIEIIAKTVKEIYKKQ